LKTSNACYFKLRRILIEGFSSSSLSILSLALSLTHHSYSTRPPYSHPRPPAARLQAELKGPDPESEHVPTEDAGYKLYQAARKLKGKRAIITGGEL
jgi:hypothetical protein